MIWTICTLLTGFSSGYGFEDGMTCYIMVMGEICSSNTSTIAPVKSSSSPTPAMTSSTPAPSAHNHFCGSSVFEAWQQCSIETACNLIPNGNEYAASQACFSDFAYHVIDELFYDLTSSPNDAWSWSPRPSIRIRGFNPTTSPSNANYWNCGATNPEDAPWQLCSQQAALAWWHSKWMGPPP